MRFIGFDHLCIGKVGIGHLNVVTKNVTLLVNQRLNNKHLIINSFLQVFGRSVFLKQWRKVVKGDKVVSIENFGIFMLEVASSFFLITIFTKHRFYWTGIMKPINDMNKKELVEELRKRKLNTSGAKNVLKERLLNAIDSVHHAENLQFDEEEDIDVQIREKQLELQQLQQRRMSREQSVNVSRRSSIQTTFSVRESVVDEQRQTG